MKYKSGLCGARLLLSEIGKNARCESCRAKCREAKNISLDNIAHGCGVRKHKRKAGDEDDDEGKGGGLSKVRKPPLMICIRADAS